MNLKEICNKVLRLSRLTGDFIREQRMQFSVDSVETKGHNDFVSYVDKKTEIQLVKGLKDILPQAGFLAEEGSGTYKPGGLNWVIDPLDGTTNFIHGLPPYAISIALMNDKTICLGVIYEVGRDECFYSWGKGKAWLNNSEIRVSQISTVKDSLIATGFPYYDYERIEPFFKTMEHFMRGSHGLRRLGSAATDLAYIACGRFDAFYEYSLKPWDVAAGSFIVEQAGGKLSDFKGQNNYIFGREIIAANAAVFQEFLSVVSGHMIS